MKIQKNEKKKNSTKVTQGKSDEVPTAFYLQIGFFFFREYSIHNHASNSCFEASYSFLK